MHGVEGTNSLSRKYSNKDRASFERMLGLTEAPKKKGNGVTTTYKSHVSGWRVIGGKRCYFRSLWEIQYAAYLEWLKTNDQIRDWEYECKTFAFPKEAYRAGPFYYKPDFCVWDAQGKRSWHEVKGYLTNDAKKKVKRFNKHYPSEPLFLVMQSEMAQIAQYRNLIPAWEYYVPEVQH